ncbi:putative aldouronate transport system substrate-binding protein [Caldicoprobacter guelmensis]|uniref:extracellular solute-binding protein n=1 Tax=Caldicoprobacter guelmensis TaxID=1170224 RepID=UPI00195ED15D|nr:extracellular solute-binding protein [Caldicoprobacter guelmensis]MBM7582060.1 putative aldouronate transport system substrate-binding protein [Caldicoprobacter guelmensis]
MKKRTLMLIGLLLCFAIAAATLSGCSSKSNSEPKQQPSSQGQNNSSEGSGGTKEPAKPVELRVEVFDRGTPGQTPVDNNYWTKWIQEQFGDKNNVKLTFVPCPRSQEVEMLNIWMSTGDAPDICLTYDVATVYKYYKEGGLADLTDALNKYGQQLKEFLGEELLAYGQYDGKQYAIPAKRVIQARTGTFIRKDWLEKLNLPVPETTEQFYNTLKAFKEKNPGNVDKVVPFAMTADVDYMAYGFFETFLEDVPDKDYYVKYRLFLPGWKEGARFLNKMYNEGLISPEFPLDKDGKMMDQDIVRGYVGAYGGNYDLALRNVPGHNNNLKKNIPGAEFIPCDPYTNVHTGQHRKELYNPTGIRIIVPKTSQAKADAVIEYLNWMADPQVLFFLQFGEEGVHHTIVDGLPKLQAVEGEKMMPSLQNIDYTLIVNGIYLADKEKTIKANAFSYPGNEHLYESAYNLAMRGGYVNPGAGLIPTEAEAKYGKVLDDKELEIYAKAITAKPEDFDKVWDSLIQEYLAAGGQEVLDQRAALWDEMYGK